MLPSNSASCVASLNISALALSTSSIICLQFPTSSLALSSSVCLFFNSTFNSRTFLVRRSESSSSFLLRTPFSSVICNSFSSSLPFALLAFSNFSFNSVHSDFALVLNSVKRAFNALISSSLFFKSFCSFSIIWRSAVILSKYCFLSTSNFSVFFST